MARQVVQLVTGYICNGKGLRGSSILSNIAVPWAGESEKSIDGPGKGRDRPHPCVASGMQINLLGSVWTDSSPMPLYDVSTIREGVIAFKESGQSPMYWAHGFQSWTDLGSPSDSEVKDAIVGAATRVASAPLSRMMNLPQAIIELRDIPKTISAARKLGSFAKKLVPGWRSRGLTVKDIASLYLAKVFGIDPTRKDINDFLGQVPEAVRLKVRQVRYKKGQPVRAAFVVEPSAVEEKLQPVSTTYAAMQYAGRGKGINYALKANYNSTSIAPKGTTETSSWPYGTGDWVQYSGHEGVMFGRVAVDFSHDFSWIEDLSINASPLSTAWELVPFSFLADWFIGLGPWLQRQNAVATAKKLGFFLEDGVWISHRSATKTFLPRLSSTLTIQPDGGYAPISPQYSRAFVAMSKRREYVLHYERFSYERKRYSVMNFPGIVYKSLSDQRAFQWATGTALAIQSFQ